MKIEAVVFDLDDTLISEKQYIASGYRAVADAIAETIPHDQRTIYEMLLDLFSESPQKVFNRLFEQLNVPYYDKDILKLVDLYRNHLPELEYYDDIIPCLAQLKAKGIKTGIITDGYISTQRQKLKVLNAEKDFDYIIVTEELGREFWKPHPRAFELTSQALNVAFDRMIYVGDNPEKDFYITAKYPIKTVRILREGIYQGRSYLEGIRENYLVHSLLEVVNLCD